MNGREGQEQTMIYIAFQIVYEHIMLSRQQTKDDVSQALGWCTTVITSLALRFCPISETSQSTQSRYGTT
jgi:hypothetical protein